MVSTLGSSPNFPPDLDIRPLALRKPTSPSSASSAADPATSTAHAAAADDDDDEWDQRNSISRYGIAGRLWEASVLLHQYLQPPATASPTFDPPCSLFVDGASSRPRTVLELGAGVGFTSCELASCLSKKDLVVMTDLPEVVELMEARRADFIARQPPDAPTGGEVWVRPLAWGEAMEEPIGHELVRRWQARQSGREDGKLLDLVVCSDLIYFPALYPPLIATLRALTSPPFDPPPEVIIAYKSRDLSKESPFWDQLAAAGFALTPIVHLPSGLLFGSAEQDRMGIFVVRRLGNGKVGGAAVTVTFEDLLFLGMGDMQDESADDRDDDDDDE